MKPFCFTLFLIGTINYISVGQSAISPIYEIKSDTVFEQFIKAEYLRVLEVHSTEEAWSEFVIVLPFKTIKKWL